MDVIPFIQSLALFKHLPKDDLRLLHDQAVLKRYDKKSILYLIGDQADFFYIIMNGWVKLSKENEAGDEAVVAILTTGDSFGDAALGKGGLHANTAQIVEGATILAVPSSAMRQVLQNNADFSYRIVQSLSERLQRLQLENANLSVMSTTQRVGCFLLQLGFGLAEDRVELTLPYDKSLAASRLGMKAESFSRALKELGGAGVKVDRNKVVIESQQALRDFSCMNCAAMPEECRRAKDGSCAACAE